MLGMLQWLVCNRINYYGLLYLTINNQFITKSNCLTKKYYLDQMLGLFQAVVYLRGNDPGSQLFFAQVTVVVLVFVFLETLLFSL